MSLKPAILVVDDDPRALLALEGHLESDTYDIVTARSGGEALRRLEEPHAFALIVTDVHMPGMSGIELATQLQQSGQSRLTPILFQTGSYDDAMTLLGGYRAGGVDFLRKPVNPEILRFKVKVFVDLWRARQELAAANRQLETEITARKQAEAAIKASLAEKEVLLREIHHRVKNNLQVVCGILGLQRNQLNNPALEAIFSEAEARVRSMALVHERLYQEHTLSSIEFASYLKSLAQDLLQQAAMPGGPKVRLELDLAEAHIPVDTAIPLGLISNELVTNALKYAYRGRTEGVLRLSLQPAGEGRLKLSVSDDGPGLPAEFDPATATSLGLQLVRMLAGQIRGTAEFLPGPAGACRVNFPIQPQTLITDA